MTWLGALAVAGTCWLVAIGGIALLLRRDPARTAGLRELLRLVPDIARLVARLARDAAVPRATRWSLWLVVAYLASPIDLVPDVLPLVGWADDVLVALWAVRRAVRATDDAVLERLWPGTAEGLVALRRACQSP